MGLDMYLEGRKYKWGEQKSKEDGFPVSCVTLELGYWRKHPNLHGYIVQEFAGGEDDCRDVELDERRLRDLLEAVRENRLPPTTGFFFGTSEESQRQRLKDVKVLTGAIRWLMKKDPDAIKSVAYRASW